MRTFAVSTVLLFVSSVALYGALLLLPLFYQTLRGDTVLDAGLLLAPQGVGMLLTRTMAGRLTDRVGSRPVVLGGLLVMVAGTAAYTRAGTDTSDVLLLNLVIRGAGFGAVTIPLMATAFIGLEREQIPHASAATRIAQQVGGSFGAAIMAMILQTQLTAHHAEGLAGKVTAFDNAFWWTLGLTAVAAIPAVVLPRRRKNTVSVQ
ncbi:MFS transporter [Actinomadura physcomitrii]|uniref:MFS transporter n=1 Tax=Actinomadura physcomitrii TaxID=2650748 RepID=UPI00136A496D|nr:MFS transporter [Actinomadura physcomitrii]